MRHGRWIVGFALVACAGEPREPATKAVREGGAVDAATKQEGAPVSERWSPVNDDLQIRAVAPGPTAPGGEVKLALHFRNTGTQTRRIYLVNSEPFRAMQSSLFLDRGADGPPVIQPEPRPHGYVVTEADFHAIEPGTTATFEQTLRLPADLAPGTYPVRWTYRNEVEQWKGGTITLDGPTRNLFEGKRIPGIWLGKQVFRFEVVVQPA